MFDSGALRLVVLGMIAQGPRHGYDIIKELKLRFQGAYSPSPGAIYPMLHMLEEAGLAVSQSWGPKKRFEITQAGRDWLEEHRAELDTINAQLDQAAAPIGEAALGESVRALRETIFGRMRAGALNAEQAQKLDAILKRAREDIEKI